mmetsp:Transcript_53859/g.128276  ORF Transcript_53859/g.128276 Transcript_53859/m.128276 type:complete len:253 (+) Transcript_53859:75-833(+)
MQKAVGNERMRRDGGPAKSCIGQKPQSHEWQITDLSGGQGTQGVFSECSTDAAHSSADEVGTSSLRQLSSSSWRPAGPSTVRGPPGLEGPARRPGSTPWPAQDAALLAPTSSAGIEVLVPGLVRDAEHGDEIAVKQRLAAGEDPDSQDEFGLTALHGAARKGHHDMVLLLLHHRAEVNRRQYRGETALHYACQYGHEAIVLSLLEHRADHSLLTGDGRTARQYAEKRNHLAVCRLLDIFSSVAGENWIVLHL